MKIYAINGSPRKKCNTAQMLQAFIAGVKESEPSAEVELINLYDYTYKTNYEKSIVKMKKNQKIIQLKKSKLPPSIEKMLIKIFGNKLLWQTERRIVFCNEKDDPYQLVRSMT